jgi:hypothetical protein
MDNRKKTANDYMPWKNKDDSDYIFETDPIVINATPEIVWEYVKDINNYATYSKDAVTAHVDGKPEAGKSITLELYKNTCAGKFIPTSVETISVVDEAKKIIGWGRPLLPCSSAKTERYQVLEPIDNGKKTLSSIAVRIPGVIGFFTNCMMKKQIENAFTDINEGIKKAAEQKALKLK